MFSFFFMQRSGFFYLKIIWGNDVTGSWKEKRSSVEVRPGQEGEFWAGNIWYLVAKDYKNVSETEKYNCLAMLKTIWLG